MRPRNGLMWCLLVGAGFAALLKWPTPEAPEMAGRPALDSDRANDLLSAPAGRNPSANDPTVSQVSAGIGVDDQVNPTRKLALPAQIGATQFAVEVVQSDQTPLSKANVVVTRDQKLLLQGETDDSGRVSFHSIEGPVEVIVFTNMALRARRMCKDGSGLERIVLEGNISLVGTVLIDGQVPGEPIWLRLESDREAEGLEKPPAWLWQELGFKGLAGEPWLWVRTDARGTFRCDGLLPGWAGTIEPGKGYRLADRSTSLHIVDPTTHVLVPLVALPQIRGRVVRPDNGLPVPHAEGTCEILCQASSLLTAVRCGPGGRFKISISGCSSFESARLEFSAPALGWASRTVESVVASSGIDLGDIVLEPVREVHFVVRNPGGIPLPGAVARGSGGGRMRSDPTDQNGKGILRDAPLTIEAILVNAFNHEPATVPVTRDVGAAVAPVEVILKPLRGLLISVEREKGGMPPHVRVVLECWDPAPFLSTDGKRPDPIQIELGASSPARIQWQPEPVGDEPALWLTYRLEENGTVQVPGLRTSRRIVVSIHSEAGKVLARQEVAATAPSGMQNLKFTLPL